MSLTCCSWPAESGSGFRDGRGFAKELVGCGGVDAVVAIMVKLPEKGDLDSRKSDAIGDVFFPASIFRCRGDWKLMPEA
jgi:hypothetical protein